MALRLNWAAGALACSLCLHVAEAGVGSGCIAAGLAVHRLSFLAAGGFRMAARCRFVHWARFLRALLHLHLADADVDSSLIRAEFVAVADGF